MKKHMIITIEGKNSYYCLVDSMNKIIVVDPPNDFLLYKDLRNLLNDYRDRVKFSVFDKDLDPDLFIAEDKLKRMLSRNESLNKLVSVFDLEINS